MPSEKGDNPDPRRGLKLFFKIAVTAVLLLLILRFVDLDSVWAIVQRASWTLLLAALAYQLVCNLTASYRWHLIMNALAFREKLSFFVKSFFKGIFFNQALPSTVGGDVIRMLEIGQRGYRKTEAFYGIAVDRIVGLLGLVLLNLAANNLNPGLLPGWLYQTINLVSLGAIAAVILFVLLNRSKFLQERTVTKIKIGRASCRERV